MKGLSKQVRSQILNKYWTEKGITLKSLAKSFNVSISCVKKTIDRFGQHYSIDDLPGRGRKPGTSDPDLEKRICNVYRQHPESSVRDVAKKLGCSVGMVQRTKQRKSLKTFKKRAVPKRTEKQEQTIKTNARKLYQRICRNETECVIMDDETYVKFDYGQMPGHEYYTVKEGRTVSEAYMYRRTEKFAKKALVWQAICTCGLKSSSFVTTGTINGQIYLEECLQKRLLPFIRRHEASTLFWPDMASCHYARGVVNWLKENDVDFVERNMNLPNCPEVRGIERYWALTKRLLKKKGVAAKSIDDLKRNWRAVQNTVTSSNVQNLMGDVRQKLRNLFIQSE